MALVDGIEADGKRAPRAESSFVGIVLVHGGPGCEGEAARLLSWYDGGAGIAPREVPCACRRGGGPPDPDCPRCGGSGRCTVMENPDAKFGSARLVGAWSEWSPRALADFAGRCAAIVTPDGEWHERGRLNGEEWRARALDLLVDHAHFAALAYEFTSSDQAESGGMD